MYYGIFTLKRGSTGAAVRNWQAALNICGHYCGKADGVYGYLTDTATRDFQSKRCIVVDGKVGPQSREMMKQALKAACTPSVLHLSNGNIQLSRNFRLSEMACSDGSDTVLVAQGVINLAQAVRDHYGAKVSVHSGYRTPEFNRTVAGASATSQHIKGMAMDLSIEGHSADEVYSYIDSLIPCTGGVGRYPTFVHVDVRDNKKRWTGA